MPQDIFNYPLRRDLIFRLYDYRIKLNKFTTKVTRTRGTTHGSNRKKKKKKDSIKTGRKKLSREAREENALLNFWRNSTEKNK